MLAKATKVAKRSKEEITVVALHVSGCQGFVEIGFHTGDFVMHQPDCAADVSMTSVGRCDFPHWRAPYVDNNRVIVEYGTDKPWNKTSRATALNIEEPYFRFARDILMSNTKDGLFDDCVSNDCLFGLQTFYFHHCEFWNRKGKKQPWDKKAFGLYVHVKP